MLWQLFKELWKPCIAVQIGLIILYFSYQTVIAFSSPKTGLVIIKNYWSKTTGKHLNAINTDKSIRVDSKEFNTQLESLLREHKLEI